MKQVILAIVLIAQVLATGSALATTVQFGGIAVSQNLVLPDSVYLDGITLSYNDFGSGTDFATVDSLGIFATTPGALLFDFEIPATTLNLGFSLFEAVSATPQIADALTVLFFGGGEFIDVATAAADFVAYDPTADPTLGSASGVFSYSGSPFDHAELYFSQAAPVFFVNSISYEPVPEPGGVLLLSVGLLAAGAWCLIRRRCFQRR